VSRIAPRVLIAVLAALALAAGASAAVSSGGRHQVGAKQNGKTVTLDRGDYLLVSLKGNATTGYAWRVASVNKSVLKPLGVRYVPNPNPEGLLGVGGVYKLRFKAIAKGRTTLRLVYAQVKTIGGTDKLHIVVR
jgi:predicted secreted protein